MTKKIVLGQRSEADLTGPELMKIGQDSVVRIECRIGNQNGGHGTAFVYKQVIDEPTQGLSRLYLVTNLHNLKGALGLHSLSVQLAQTGRLANELTISMVVTFQDAEYEVSRAILSKGKLFSKNQFFDDFFFFHIDVPTNIELKLFAIPTSDDMLQGATAYALGFPADTHLGITEGIVSHIYGESAPTEEQKWQIQHSILINGGNSGGPTVSSRGVAIGISTWGQLFNGSQRIVGLNYSVDLQHLFDRAKDPSILEEVDLKALFAKLATRAIEEARFGN
jgi:S1-C subfamily serine protease